VHTARAHAEIGFREKGVHTLRFPVFGRVLKGTIERPILTLALASVPISIAATESFLVIALVARLYRFWHRDVHLQLPRVFWYWLVLAAVEVLVWLFSPTLRDGWGEIRHLLLVGSLFLTLPALDNTSAFVTAWKGIFLGSALGSFFLIGDFSTRLSSYHREIAAGEDVSFYLRTGGLLSNWMVFGTVEILVVAGLLSFWFAYPELRRRWWPVMALNAIAVVLSLTRTLWVATSLLLAIQLWRKRSRWLWILPFLIISVYLLAPGAVRSRLKVSIDPDYFSNAERIQMLRVGWRMVRDNPWFGTGPGRVDKLYLNYLEPSDGVPKYHGHLHNNLAQMAAQFGVPATIVAIFFLISLFRGLSIASRRAENRERQFLSQAALHSLLGFVVAGCFDYTYGHSLGLILLMFAVLAPLMPESAALLTAIQTPETVLFNPGGQV
jgi:O-antigen ligase